jgi:phage/plasmid-like protein (TIGR03299 family)
MAHNINFNDETGKHSFFSVQQKAWHGLGQIVEGYPTSKEALQLAGLDFNVVKMPNVHRLQDGTEVVSDNSFFTYRTDNGAILGDKVGKDYNIVQNVDAFSFFDAIVNGDGVMYETAGALGQGEQIFITAKLPGYIRVGKDDMIEKFLFLTTAHDGSGSIIAAFTPIRIVCQNTLNAALRNNTQAIRLRHTANVEDRLKEAHKIMGITNTLSNELEGILNQWTKVKITDKQVLQLIQQAMCPSKEVRTALKNGEELSTAFSNICENAFQYAMISPTQQTETTKGTLFGAYNAVTGYFQNVKDFKGDSDAKVKSLLMGGTGQLRTQAAFNLCSDFAKHGADSLLLN